MMVQEKRDVSAVPLKFGVALALSLGGFLYTILKNKRTIKPSQSPPTPRISDCGNQLDSRGERVVCRNDCQTSPTGTMSPLKDDPCMPEVPLDNTAADQSPNGIYNGDRDGLLLPECDEFVRNIDLDPIQAGIISPRKDVGTLLSDLESMRQFKSVEKACHDQEIKNLRQLVKVLKNREQALEVQLLEYNGLKEQESAVMELQNRLKLNNMESKVFSLKIESLRADNKRLEAQVADHAKVVAELEAARAKVKLLKKKLRYEAEQNKEQILNLQQRVAKLQDEEHKSGESDAGVRLKLQKLKNLEEQAKELRKTNCDLHQENSDLGQRLEAVQMLATSAIEDGKRELLEEESHHLKQQNEDLVKEIEQLKADRCTELEELVYLRWINACLRYELKNYQPSPGRTLARDLSRTLSPKSEEKAKQLIMEYANKEGLEEKGLSFMEFDYDQWSSSPASSVTDSGELDESSVDDSSDKKSHSSTKLRVFSKLRRLLMGDSHHHSHHSLGHDYHSHCHDHNSSHDTPVCMDQARCSSHSTVCNSSLSTGSEARTPAQGLPRSSLDSQRSLKILRTKGKLSNDMVGVQRCSYEGSSSANRTFGSVAEDIADLFQEDQIHLNSELDEQSKLVKYAEALKDSRGPTSNRRKTAASRRSF